LIVGSSDGKVFIVSEYKFLTESSLNTKVFINCIKKIKIDSEIYFLVAGENELFCIFDISFKIVYSCKLWK
jgi:hypothetical protein